MPADYQTSARFTRASFHVCALIIFAFFAQLSAAETIAAKNGAAENRVAENNDLASKNKAVGGALDTAFSANYLAAEGSVSRITLVGKPPSLFSHSQREISSLMREAWRKASDDNKVVMMVLGADNCDRCQLLDKYMRSVPLKPRIDQHFIVLNMGIDAVSEDIEVATEHLPAIVLVESSEDVRGALSTERMLTFMPEPHEALYDWMESLLFYSDQVFSASRQAQPQLSGG